MIVKKTWDQLSIPLPDFSDTGTLLQTLGTIIVKDIGRMIDQEVKPDGSPQQQNKPGPYRELKKYLKGYTTPLKGLAPESPYLRQPKAWRKDLVSPTELRIHANTLRSEAVERLAHKGYWIVGISVQAEALILKRVYQYLRQKVAKMTGGSV